LDLIILFGGMVKLSLLIGRGQVNFQSTGIIPGHMLLVVIWKIGGRALGR
jgi:hypothetical protein